MILDQEQRYIYRTDTLSGALLRLWVARKRLQREIDKTFPFQLLYRLVEKHPILPVIAGVVLVIIIITLTILTILQVNR